MLDQIIRVKAMPETMIVTGASRGIGTGFTKAFVPEIDDIVEAVAYLTEGRPVTWEVPHVDARAHSGEW